MKKALKNSYFEALKRWKPMLSEQLKAYKYKNIKKVIKTPKQHCYFHVFSDSCI